LASFRYGFPPEGAAVGSVYALFALGFTLIFGVHHILNMAHGAVFMWGAFFGLFAITRFDLPFPLGFVLAIVLAGLLSVALDWVAFRPCAGAVRRNSPLSFRRLARVSCL
jgi:branched-chain amino acid transport system permease protein